MSDLRISPLHASLNETVQIMAGAEKSLAAANLAFTLAFVMAARVYWWAIAGAVIHMFLVWLTKRDPLTRKIYVRYRRQGLTYDPWPSRWQRRNVRPAGFSAGALL